MTELLLITGTMEPRNVLTTVIPANPLQFLSENAIMILGSTANNPDVFHRNLVNFYFTYQPGQDRYYFAPTGLNPAPAGAYAFTPVSVPAIHWSQIPGRGNLELPPAAGIQQGLVGSHTTGAVCVMEKLNGSISIQSRRVGLAYDSLASRDPGR
jgi:hypothetical protein